MKQREWLLVLVALVSASAYILIASVRGVIGFPLDDAWIHQVYARNLAWRGEFAFFAGQPSAGSTSPLWTILLALGYLLHVDFRVWSYLLGILLLGLSALFAARLIERLVDLSRSTLHVSRITLYISLFTLFEWHLVWSAVSGMEILLFVFLSLFLLERFYAHERVWLLGLIAGLLTLTRPEGVLLGALVALGQIIRLQEKHQVSQRNLVFDGIGFGIGFALVIVPDLIFNFVTSGTIFPNTFYAKAAEYASLFENSSLVVRWLRLLFVPWIGAQILLLPGAIYIAATLVCKRQWLALIPFAWLLLLPSLYALRLPVDYQHGRYEMPVVPFTALYGMWGTLEFFTRFKSWILQTTLGISTAVVLVLFWLLGANQYATDVSIIDCEMVQTARWIAARVPAGSVIAAHDIGALGYYYNSPFIDLAGLATPEVIPFIRDEGRLRDFLFSRRATFLIVFQDWYQVFSSDSRFVPVYDTRCTVTQQAGEKNMIVYEINR